MASPKLKAQIFANEQAVWDAAQRRDIERFKELVAPDALMIFTSGVKTRAEYLSSIDSRQIKTFVLEDFQVFTPAADTAISVYRATISGVFGGKEVAPTTIREASVWVKRGSRWVAVMNQETAID